MAYTEWKLPGSRRWRFAIAGLLAALALPVYAGTAQSSFPVSITLVNPAYTGVPATTGPGTSNPQAFCVNRTLSAENNATVIVTCSTNLFVSIEPAPGQIFSGSNGGAYRFLFPAALNAKADDLTWLAGRGTVTSIRISTLKNNPWDIMEIQVNY